MASTAARQRKTQTTSTASTKTAKPKWTAEEQEAIDLIDHRRGCPATRLEAYTSRRPENQGGGEIAIGRCIECGQQATSDHD